ncbi:MAG: Holliday junction resolvase RuvX [Gammaproteobacteria bacterium]|nr:Holliday junction resolvase RuvX [Gammaproteobacteria bacterium]MCP4091587.1 Holliday junction resolvase RuvX [Gammaproteobacteria bacterium]MCP4276083.1 Holliday junction resolvase RuvX [Gammaproteobacteria bacterium]MCP4832575.1 Holliday junction resolvase RuvX [Gammaproteobacteria bacterium]MCP4929653.1 Holliday junction resolvase RuvX [Gammaproteobacteria bacterium]
MNGQLDKRYQSLIAIDYGLRRIGIATGACLTGISTPLTTLSATQGTPDWAVLDKVIQEWQPDLLVLGLPYNKDGSESDMTTAVKLFADKLQSHYTLPVEFIDERYTSVEAEAILKEQRRTGIRTKKLKKEDVDAKAAQIIAESWMRTTKNLSPS